MSSNYELNAVIKDDLKSICKTKEVDAEPNTGGPNVLRLQLNITDDNLQVCTCPNKQVGTTITQWNILSLVSLVFIST